MLKLPKNDGWWKERQTLKKAVSGLRKMGETVQKIRCSQFFFYVKNSKFSTKIYKC